MAVVREVCGKCGATVARTDTRCGSCGEELVREETTIRCRTCGARNPEGSSACTACGARLGEAERRRQKGVPARSAKRPEGERRGGARAGKRFEPWQIVSFVAVGGLLAVLVYVELSRDHGAAGVMPPVSGQPVQPGPAMQMPPPVDLAPLEAAVAARPDDHEALLRLANALHDNGAFARAVDTYKKYLALHPNDTDARVDMGVCYYELGLADSVNPGRYLDLAVAEMEAAFRGAPTHQQAAYNLGVVNLQRGRLEESTTWFRRAMEINKTSELGLRAQRMVEQHSMNP